MTFSTNALERGMHVKTVGEAPLLDAEGSALVIRAGADDYKSDPAGNSGDRIACGVITP